MHTIRSAIFGLADDIYMACQNAGKIFGYLSDGRDLITSSAGPDGLVVTMPDHEDEGWPEVRATIPDGAAFLYAASGPITRIACWTIPRPVMEVRADFSLEERTELGPRTTMIVRGKEEKTIIAIKQARRSSEMRPNWYAREHRKS